MEEEPRQAHRQRTRRWLLKGFCLAVLASILASWVATAAFEGFARGMGSTTQSDGSADLYFQIGGVWVLLGAVAMLIPKRPALIVLITTLTSAGMPVLWLVRPNVQGYARVWINQANAAKQAANLAEVEEQCAFHLLDEKPGFGVHHLWEGDRLIQLQVWKTVVQSNPVGVRRGAVLEFWENPWDFGERYAERLDHAARAVDDHGAHPLDQYEVIRVQQTKQAYEELLNEAQRRYNRH